MNPIRVVLADDHTILRDGVRLLLEQQHDMTVVSQAVNWDEAHRCAVDLNPDVITVDLSMPGGPPFERIRQLVKAAKHSRVLVLTMHMDIAYVRAAIAAGASGFVPKAAAGEELLAAIRKVASGELYTPILSTIAELPQHTSGTPVLPDDDYVSLSPREREVLKGTAIGLTNRQMAETLFLSVKTIESYRSRLMTKLGLKSRSDLVQYAIRHGLLDR